MTAPIKVIITINFDEATIQRFREVSSQVEILHRPARTYTDVAGQVWADAEILYTNSILPPGDAMPKLKWVQSHFAGVDNILKQPLIADHPEVVVTSTRGIHATNLAEFVLGSMLLLARSYHRIIADQHKKVWAEDKYQKFMPTELRGSTVGIVGYGAIGREVARLSKAFGMSVLASKRNVKQVEASEYYKVEGTGDVQGDFFDRLYPPQALATMVKDCDFVVLILPITPETRQLYNEKVMQAMKPGSFLVNVGRGGVVDENALLDALKSGHLGGALMDVFEQEPLPEDHPLWSAPNLIITPHLSGNTTDYADKAAKVFEENLRRYVEGKALMNVVDREAGY